MANPENAEIRIVSATWGAAVGICADFSWTYSTQHIMVRDEDSVNPDKQLLVGKMIEAEVMSIHSPLTASDTPASLVIITRKGDGNTKTETLTNMILVEVSKSFNRDSAPAMYKHKFISSGTVTQP